MSNPRDALHQMALLRDRLGSWGYERYMDAFQYSANGKSAFSIQLVDDSGKPSGRAFTTREIKRLEMAEAFYVTKDMTQVIRWASQSLDESDAFRHDLWPTDFGFVFFEDALLHTEARGRKMTIKAMTWGRVNQDGHAGTYLVTYSNPHDPRDEIGLALVEHDGGAYRDLTQALGPLHVSHLAFIPDGRGVGPATIKTSEDDDNWLPDPPSALPRAEVAENPDRDTLALLMLLNQTLTSVKEADLDRATRKRMARMNLPAKVTVVALRRTEGSRQVGESLVEWQHRWLVRMHWRWQPYGRPDSSHTHEMGEVFSEQGRLVRLCLTAGCDRHWERICIAPFVKGPEGLPFKQSTKVYNLAR